MGVSAPKKYCTKIKVFLVYNKCPVKLPGTWLRYKSIEPSGNKQKLTYTCRTKNSCEIFGTVGKCLSTQNL